MKAQVGDIEIAYDIAGQGDPVLLVMGWATPRQGWIPTIIGLSPHFETITFDNRGIGETTLPAEQWTMEQMVADAVGLLDVLERDTVHLIGVSMGGMISQEIALRHPDRVRTLTLIATTHGGPDMEQPDPSIAAGFADPAPEARARAAVEIVFGTKYRTENPEIIDAVIAFMAANPQPIMGVINQMMAIMGWQSTGGAAARLGEIAMPTLVMHGGDDRLLPFRNGELLAKAIPGARFEAWPEAGHGLTQEYADEVNAALLSHLGA